MKIFHVQKQGDGINSIKGDYQKQIFSVIFLQ